MGSKTMTERSNGVVAAFSSSILTFVTLSAAHERARLGSYQEFPIDHRKPRHCRVLAEKSPSVSFFTLADRFRKLVLDLFSL